MAEGERRSAGGGAARRADLLELVLSLDADLVPLLSVFARQVLACHDPDAVRAFLRWRDDPRLESLLQIAALLDDEALDQLVFAAEDLLAETAGPQPVPG